MTKLLFAAAAPVVLLMIGTPAFAEHQRSPAPTPFPFIQSRPVATIQTAPGVRVQRNIFFMNPYVQPVPPPRAPFYSSSSYSSQSQFFFNPYIGNQYGGHAQRNRSNFYGNQRHFHGQQQQFRGGNQNFHGQQNRRR